MNPRMRLLWPVAGCVQDGVKDALGSVRAGEGTLNAIALIDPVNAVRHGVGVPAVASGKEQGGGSACPSCNSETRLDGLHSKIGTMAGDG
jgi:hypothetical protein